MSRKILGLGIDLIEVARVQEALKEYGQSFLKKLFVEKERIYLAKYAAPDLHIAGFFAAKEAIAKAWGVGFGKDLSFGDIEITHDTLGKPSVIFHGGLHQKEGQIHLSISHTDHYAMAVAIWESEGANIVI